jgi:hypothetical protein
LVQAQLNLAGPGEHNAATQHGKSFPSFWVKHIRACLILLLQL